MRLLWLVAAVAALAAITIWGPTWVIVAAWIVAALAIIGAGMNRSPAVQLRGRRGVKRP